MEAWRIVATDFAQLGGSAARPFFGNAKSSQKSDNTPVTQADHAAQAAILAAIASRYPDHAVICEERIAQPEQHAPVAAAEYCWVIDPVDGTRNFAKGIPIYACSVALMHKGYPIAGSIFDASTSRVYSAARGHGAYCDNVRLQSHSFAEAGDVTILISSFRQRKTPFAIRQWMDEFLFRNQGSLALHLAWVAAGLADAAYAAESKLWDIAAGALMIDEAGRRITTESGADLWPIDLARYESNNITLLAATDSLHARLLDDLQNKIVPRENPSTN